MKSPWLLRILALAGFLISSYLLYKKLSGQIDSIVGCGGGSGCANVLGSRWSQFFGIPVSAFSSVLYLVLLASTWKPSRTLRGALAVCFVGAALWFFGILIFELKAFCPWCTAAHLIGLTCATLLFLGLRKDEPKQAPPHLGLVGGGLAVFVLILGQIAGPIPDTHLVTGGSMEQEESGVHAGNNGGDSGNPGTANADTPPTEPAAGKGRVVAVFDDNKSYNTATLPHLGPADAPHVIVKYFDYTCSSCLTMHQDLEMVAEKYPGKFCMIMLPVPLSRECNEHFPKPYTNHKFACELTRLGLAAWRANPEAWPEVHETLFTRPVLEPEMAEIAVAQIVGEEELTEALKDPWIEEMIVANKSDFKQLINPPGATRVVLPMPKLLVGKGRMLHGLPKSAEVLLQSLEQEFKLTGSQ